MNTPIPPELIEQAAALDACELAYAAAALPPDVLARFTRRSD